MNKFNVAHLSDNQKSNYLVPMTNALGIMGYDVLVMCVPKSTSSDLPILTDGNVSIARAKVMSEMDISSYFKHSVIFRLPWPD